MHTRSTPRFASALAACVALSLVALTPAAYAQTTINQTFTCTGSNQFFVVPTGVSTLTVYI